LRNDQITVKAAKGWRRMITVAATSMSVAKSYHILSSRFLNLA
jgi:hypothetical protein